MEKFDFRPIELNVFNVVQNINVEILPQVKEPIVIDRYRLSVTWYNLLTKLAGRHPSVLDKTMMDMAYNKIIDRMMTLTDDELMKDMEDIIKSVNYISLSILPAKKGYYKK